MAYIKKNWIDRHSAYPNRRMMIPVNGQANVYDVSREEGLITDEGHPFDAKNMNDLETRVDTAVKELISGAVKVGKAAAADSANAVAWGNVSGKPGFLTAPTYTATIGTVKNQNIAVAGVLATDTPIVDVLLCGDRTTDENRLEAWGDVSRITTYNGGITVTCYQYAPTVAIPIQIRVVR